MPRGSPLTPEQRAQVVLRRLSKEEPAARIAHRAGISEQTLYRWRDASIRAGERALNGKGPEAEQTRALERLEAEIAERERVIGELTIANRLLKKLSGALR